MTFDGRKGRQEGRRKQQGPTRKEDNETYLQQRDTRTAVKPNWKGKMGEDEASRIKERE